MIVLADAIRTYRQTFEIWIPDGEDPYLAESAVWQAEHDGEIGMLKMVEEEDLGFDAVEAQED